MPNNGAGRAEKPSHGGRQLVQDTVAAAFDTALDDGSSTPFSKMVALVQTASGWPDHPGSALFGVGSFVKLSIGGVHWIVGWLITIIAQHLLGLPLPLARVLGRLLSQRLLAGLNPAGGYADRMRLLGAWWAVAAQDPAAVRDLSDLLSEHGLARIKQTTADLLCPDDTRQVGKLVPSGEPLVSEPAIGGTPTANRRPQPLTRPVRPMTPPRKATPPGPKTPELKRTRVFNPGPTPPRRTAQSTGDRDRPSDNDVPPSSTPPPWTPGDSAEQPRAEQAARPGQGPTADQSGATYGQPAADMPTEPPPAREPTAETSSSTVGHEATDPGPSASATFIDLTEESDSLPVREYLGANPKSTTNALAAGPKTPVFIDSTEDDFPYRGPLDADPGNVVDPPVINEHTTTRELGMNPGSGFSPGV